MITDIEASQLVETIKAHLIAGGRVMVASYTRPVIYDKRHIDMFRADQDTRGVRIGWPGKKSVYAFQSSIVFSRHASR